MRKYLLLLFFAALTASAQGVRKYGYLHCDSLFQSLPEYKEQAAQLDQLRAKYAAETEYNEADFKRQFAEYLQGQATFPQTILLKRQRDLQEALEKSLAFRQEADSLLRAAEADLRRPLRNRLAAAIAAVGRERGYEAVINLDANTHPYLNPALSEDITAFVREKMAK